MKSQAPDQVQVEEFSQYWERSSELRDVLSRLPGQLVLKSGLSAKRGKLLERWDHLPSPGIDGSIDSDALDVVKAWIYEAELAIAFIVQIVKEERATALSRVFSNDDYVEFEVVNSIDEVEYVTDEWCWPWPCTPARASKKGIDKDKMFKYGALGALGLIAVVTYLDEE